MPVMDGEHSVAGFAVPDADRYADPATDPTLTSVHRPGAWAELDEFPPVRRSPSGRRGVTSDPRAQRHVTRCPPSGPQAAEPTVSPARCFVRSGHGVAA